MYSHLGFRANQEINTKAGLTERGSIPRVGEKERILRVEERRATLPEPGYTKVQDAGSEGVCNVHAPQNLGMIVEILLRGIFPSRLSCLLYLNSYQHS